MESEDEKKYNIFENILQKVNQKYISLPEEEVKRNNQLLLIIDKIIQKMKSKSVLFHNLFQNKYYGGSYYDGLKVGKPSEYDLDCVLKLPKIVKAAVEISDKPGYVHVVLNDMGALQKKVDEAPKYEGLNDLLDGNRLSAKKVKSWMESLMASVKTEKIDNNISLKVTKSGPALTIKMNGIFDEKPFNIDVDVVPCFTFFDDQWPAGNYRPNTSQKKKNTFFVVPKTPSDEEVHYWRLSFQEQERELINDYRVMKPTIKLIKKIRDRYEHKIASYFIKTVFLWELDKLDKSLWEKSLSFVFLTMLRKYADYVSKKSIPYYWNEEYNLIDNLSDSTAECIANKIRNIVEKIDTKCLNRPYDIVNFLLLKSEYDMEVFQQEAPLGKKFLKQINFKKSQENLAGLVVTTEPQLTSTPSSVSSSFEEITKEMLIESPSKESSSSNLEILCLEQKKITQLLETAIKKIDMLDDKVTKWREEIDSKITEEKQERSELVKMVNMLNRKVDDLIKKQEKSPEDDLFLPIEDMLKRTADFLNK